MPLARIPNRLGPLRIPKPDVPIVSARREDTFARFPFGTEDPALVAREGCLGELDFHVPEAGGGVA